MPREYRHIEQYAQEILELQKQGYRYSVKNQTDTTRKAMSVRCLNFNIFYHLVCFCTVRTIWGSSP